MQREQVRAHNKQDNKEIVVNQPIKNHPLQPVQPSDRPAEVGQRLRALRQQRRMSLREAARLSGVSVNALSMIEHGKSSPSVSTLYRLVEALGAPITAIFRDEPQREDIVFRTASQRTQAPFAWGVWEGLGGEDFVGRVQPFILNLEKGASSGAQIIVHTGHEFVLCLQGGLEYEVEGKKFSLRTGDSLLFAARLRHRWRNQADAVTQALIVLSGFEEYESPMGFHIS
jgi:transcriptional regulator with XRE-family HTH domain